MPPHIYLSPHLDDAIYSCGGLIARQIAAGEPVSVVTVCAGDPPEGALTAFAQELHARWGTGGAAAMARRRLEDLAACSLLDALPVHFGVPDAVYRKDETGRPLYPDETAIFDELHGAEAELVEQVAEAIDGVCGPDAQLYVPLSLGGHVDHRLTRQAAERLYRRLRYFPDFPYAARGGQPPEGLPVPDGVARIVALAEDELEQWSAAAAAYETQLSTFWSSPEALEQELLDYHAQAGGLRLVTGEPV